MSIITISRGSYSRGKEVAELLAEKLEYACISREILLSASEQFNIPEMRLVRTLHDAPSVFDRFAHGKERYVAYIRAAILKMAQKGNAVYHGLAGHFFLQGIPHALKVRIIADIEDRVKEEMRRMNIPEDDARYTLIKDDDERRRWGLYLYGIDTHDPHLYDLLIHTRNLSVEDAVEIILHAVKQKTFQVTPESQRVLDNLALAAQIEATLIKEFPFTEAVTDNGKVHVTVKAPLSLRRKLTPKIKDTVKRIGGVNRIDITIIPIR
ncbi:MAG: cytidylate kinase-like family protein [Deltaproteobacteria bacterium]|nr:cytidylate kinase-like family protein [Deltaproteobacteria bacterium]